MIVLRALLPGMEHGLLAKWRVQPGDTVRVGDVVAEIETDKALVELESDIAGVIEELCVAEGTAVVAVNTTLARMRGEAPAAIEAQTAKPARKFASPAARRMAREGSIDLDSVNGTGPRGRVTVQDVGQLLADRERCDPPAPAIARGTGLGELAALGIAPDSYTLLPLDGMRQAIARRTRDAFRDIPHFPLTIDVEVDELLALRARLNAALAPADPHIGMDDVLIRAVALSLLRVPGANASYTSEGIALHRHADIAFAVALDAGLVMPVVRRAESKTLREIAGETSELVRLARERRLRPEQYRGGSFSISNLGMFGIRSFASILNAPQACILSVGAAERRVVARDTAVAVATIMTLTLTCDHRAIDGATGARFLAALREALEAPIRLLS